MNRAGAKCGEIRTRLKHGRNHPNVARIARKMFFACLYVCSFMRLFCFLFVCWFVSLYQCYCCLIDVVVVVVFAVVFIVVTFVIIDNNSG